MVRPEKQCGQNHAVFFWRRIFTYSRYDVVLDEDSPVISAAPRELLSLPRGYASDTKVFLPYPWAPYPSNVKYNEIMVFDVATETWSRDESPKWNECAAGWNEILGRAYYELKAFKRIE